MLDYLFVVFFLSAVKIILKPLVIIPLTGILISFLFLPERSDRFWIIGLFILTGICIELLEFSLSGYREQFLDSHSTIDFRNFPEEATEDDRLLHIRTFVPSLILLFLLLYGGISYLNFPAIKSPFLISIIVSSLCLILITSENYIKVPGWHPNGSPPIKEKLFDIHLAAQNGDLERLKTLTRDKKEMLNRKTNKGMAPLHLAITEGHFEAAKFLVEQGANLNLKGSSFKPRTPLMLAAEKGDRKTVEFLLERGADPHILTDELNNVLYSASEHPDIFKLFIELKVNFENINWYGESILSIVARMDKNFKPHPLAYSLAKYLLELGIPPNGLPGEGARPLVEAAAASNIKVLRLLLSKGAHPDAKDKFKCTPLITSMSNRSFEMVSLLLKKGADPNLPGSSPGRYSETFKPLELIDKIESNNGMYDEEQKRKLEAIRSLLVQAGAR
jgi:ankyrin repeat protein